MSSASLAPVQNGALATTNKAELDLIRTQYAKVLNDHEFQLFVAEAQHRRLDILQGHFQAIRFKGNNEPATFYPTVHGLLALADRHAMNDGIEGPHYCGPGGEWREVWTDKEPYAARVIVHRKDRTHPTIRIAYMSERKRTSPIWSSMPRHMLGKTALTDALKASGLINDTDAYVTEEVEVLPDGTMARVVEDRHDGALRRVHAIGSAKGVGHEQIRGVVKAINPGVGSLRDATPSELNQAGDIIENAPRAYVDAVVAGDKRLDEPVAAPAATPNPEARDTSAKPTPKDWSDFWKYMKSFGQDGDSYRDLVGQSAAAFKTPEGALEAFKEAGARIDAEMAERMDEPAEAEFVESDDPRVDDFSDVDPATGEIAEPTLPGMGGDPGRYTK